MIIELSLDQHNEITRDSLYDDIKDFERMILQNYGYHYGDVGTFAPLYSWDYDEENKKLNKMLKSLIRIYNHYSEVEYESVD